MSKIEVIDSPYWYTSTPSDGLFKAEFYRGDKLIFRILVDSDRIVKYIFQNLLD